MPQNDGPTDGHDASEPEFPIDYTAVKFAICLTAGIAVAILSLMGYWQPAAVMVPSVIVFWFAAAQSQDALLENRLSAFWFDTTFSAVDHQFLPALGIVAILAFVANWLEPFRWLLSFGLYASLVMALSSCLLAITIQLPERKKGLLVKSLLACSIGAVAWFISPSSSVEPSAYASVHPIFNTPISGRSSDRPAVMVAVKDDTEMGGLATAELYLSVQTSRFPSDVHVVLPINRGSFRGCRTRFVQLPFEVLDGDNLIFELIDDNQMTPEQEQLVLSACEAGGFCVRLGNAILQPQLDWIVAPTANTASHVISEGTVMSFQDSPFRNFGAANFIVESSRPTTPNAANPIDLLDKNNYSRASAYVYFPFSPLPSTAEK